MLKRILSVLFSSIVISALFTGCKDAGKVDDIEEIEFIGENNAEIETQNNVSITGNESDTSEEQSIAHSSTDNSADIAAANSIDYETLGIQKYEYPSEFSLGDNLKTAITQLALSYENFNKGSVSSGDWKEIFIARFIQNSRLSFDYLDMISEENNGQISAAQLNYIQYSLTNTEVDFSLEAGETVNRNDAASPLNYGWISEYSYEETNDGAIVTAYLETGYDGTDSMKKRKITVELIKNPYSCFDGYSVIAVSSETEDNDAQMPKYDELENLIGEYDYQSDYGAGKLIINKTAYGYDISDYESESSYRFLANSSNIDIVENNRIYIKYPEQVFSDDTVVFSYYILEYNLDGINVYCAESADEEGRFLYHATRENIDAKTTQIREIYEGEYTGNTISDPDYDGLEIQKNEDDTYTMQVKIPFLTKLYECTGYQSENIILFSTSEWGTDKKVEGNISFDGDSATVTFTSGWYQTATTENSYQYQKTSNTPSLESGPDVRPDYSSFTGEYCDDNGDPSLEIRQNEDGSYLIQISLFRDIGYDACIGSLAEGKISFASDERGGVSGSITLDNDLAVVCFDHVGHFENAKVTTYMFHKTSDNPNIDELN